MILATTTAQALAAEEAKEAMLPSPPSTGGTNVCPRCWSPCSAYPWTCHACGWTAASDPRGCCTSIRPVVVDPKDPAKASYDIPQAEVDAAKVVPIAKRTEREKILASVTAVTVEPEREVIR